MAEAIGKFFSIFDGPATFVKGIFNIFILISNLHLNNLFKKKTWLINFKVDRHIIIVNIHAFQL